MLKIAIAFALVYLVFWSPVILAFLVNLLSTIWNANPNEIKKVQDMIRLVELANNGDLDAQQKCENNPLFKKSLEHDGKKFVTHYSVPRSVRLAPFMNHGAGVD